MRVAATGPNQVTGRVALSALTSADEARFTEDERWIEIDEDVRGEYWRNIRRQPDRVRERVA
jgi:hypothetical protein